MSSCRLRGPNTCSASLADVAEAAPPLNAAAAPAAPAPPLLLADSRGGTAAEAAEEAEAEVVSSGALAESRSALSESACAPAAQVVTTRVSRVWNASEMRGNSAISCAFSTDDEPEPAEAEPEVEVVEVEEEEEVWGAADLLSSSSSAAKTAVISSQNVCSREWCRSGAAAEAEAEEGAASSSYKPTKKNR
jgi:hypothetical protein